MTMRIIRGRNSAVGDDRGVAWTGPLLGRTNVYACGAWGDSGPRPVESAVVEDDPDDPQDWSTAAVPVIGTALVTGTGGLLFLMVGLSCPPGQRVWGHGWVMTDDEEG